MDAIFFLLLSVFATTVRAQITTQVECRTALDCSGPSTVTTLEECCLGDGNLAFTVPSIDRCNPCIVFGWTQDSFTGVERGFSYTLNVGFIKGARQATNLEFDVTAISGTAKEGPSNDYTLQTTTGVRIFSILPTRVGTVSFTFHADGVAQEPNETLSFELVPTPRDNPLFRQEGVIFKNITNLTIVDSDSLGISFSEGDYSTTELVNGVPGVLNVIVTKTSRIASPVILTVTPLTVKTAMASGVPVPPAIPPDNEFSPNRASYEDFNNTVFTITFDPDEDGSFSVNNIQVPISVVDDDINEATEQVFVVQLKLISSVNSDSVVLTQATSLCIIRDNDDMRIGFIQQEYSYIEPEAETTIDTFYEPQPNKSGPVFLQKEGGVVTEQTFRIAVSTTSTVPSGRDIQPATLGDDYRLSLAGGTSVIEIRPNEEKINFEFALFTDNLPEGTEAFQASSSPDSGTVTINGTTFPVPTYLSPRELSAQSFIIIFDDDDITIGFEQTSYTVNESVGTQKVFVSVFNPPDVDNELPVDEIKVNVLTVSGTADGGVDYRNLSDDDVVLTFNNEVRRQSFDVTIIDDSLFEPTEEEFTLKLVLMQSLPDVEIDPESADITIVDDDEAIIGFLDSSYESNENEDSVKFLVGVIDGTLEREVVVSFSTSDKSAVDGEDYIGMTNFLLTFAPDILSIDVPVPLVNNDVFERTESFDAFLTFLNPVPRVTLDPDQVNATIIDEDELVFGFEPTEYNVLEDGGSVVLTVMFSDGDAGEFVPHSTLSTVDGTAIGSPADEADFTSVELNTISFTNLQRTQTIEIDITTDSLTERNETFTVDLTDVFLASMVDGAAIQLSAQEKERLLLNPARATVNILDDDKATIGFVKTAFSIVEGSGNAVFQVAVLDGNLRIDVPVTFFTVDNTALDGSDYNSTTTNLAFSSTSSSNITVGIIDDLRFEVDETFFGRLAPIGTLPSNVFLAPVEAVATIEDTDIVIIGFAPSVYTVNEAAGTVTLTVKVLWNETISPGITISVSLQTNDGTAQAPSDYGNTTSVLAFTNTQDKLTIVVPIINDTALEIDETFGATISLIGDNFDGRITLAPSQASITIADDDEATIGFEPEDYTVTEGEDEFAVLMVKLTSGTLGRDVIVSLNIFDGSATSGSDYQAFTRLLMFGPTVSEQTVSVFILNDDIFEDLIENFTSIIDSDVPRLNLEPDEAVVNIMDDDNVTIGFDREQYDVIEHQKFANVTVRLISGTLDSEVVVTLTTGDGTAVSSGEFDYVAISHDLIFSKEITEQTVMIRINDDSLLENNERFSSFVSLFVDDQARINLIPAEAAILIIDDDRVEIGFDSTLYVVDESAGTAQLLVRLINGELRRNVLVTVSTMDNTAFDGSDYSAVSAFELTFDQSNTQFLIPVNIINDRTHELNETFFGILTTTDEDTSLAPDRTMVRILDDDSVTFMFRQMMYNFMENIGTTQICVDKVGTTDQTISVMLTGPLQAETGDVIDQVLSFSPDTTARCVNLDVKDDNIALEDTETLVWAITVPPTIPRVNLNMNETTIVIIDDDVLTLTLVKQQAIPESAGDVLSCVSFSNPFAREFTITPATRLPSNITNFPALATPGMDYTSDTTPFVATLVDSASGQVCFTIRVNNDALVEEPMECLLVSFEAESIENLEVANNSDLCCIVDDDNVTIGFSPVSYSISEAGPTVRLMVQVLVGELERAVSVSLSTLDGTATSTTPIDYTGVLNAPLQFDADNLVRTVDIFITNDAITENTEFFSGVLSTSDSAVVLNPNSARVEITDNDNVTIGFEPDVYNVNETDRGVTLTVALLIGVLEKDVVVNFQTTPGTASSAAPADYNRITDTLTFSPGIDRQQVSVAIVNDNIHENNETFFGLLTPGDQVIVNPDTAIVTIIDDNDPITIGFEETDVFVPEGDERMLCVRLISGTLEKKVLVSVRSLDITATSSDDYDVVNLELTFDADNSRLCFNTSTVEDERLEGSETYRLTLTSVEPGLSLEPDEAVVTITDGNVIVIGFEETEYDVTEGDDLTVEVCAVIFDGELARDAVVTLTTSDGSAVSIGPEPDYVAFSTELTFSSSLDRICSNISITDDNNYEVPESFIIVLTTPDSDVVLMPNQAVVNIEDDDEVVIGFVDLNYIIEENGGQQEVCASVMSGTLRDTIGVDFSTSNGTAGAGVDYNATSDVFSFSSSNRLACTNVPIVNDEIAEGPENFFGNLMTDADRIVLNRPTTTVTIQDDDDVTIGFVQSTYSISEEGGFVVLTTGVLSGMLSKPYVVQLNTIDILGIDNSAIADKDYTPRTVNLTFSSSVTRHDVRVPIINDSIVELDELFDATLTRVTLDTSVSVFIRPDAAIVTILDVFDSVVIGLTETFITEDESIDVRKICAMVISGTLERPVEVTLTLNPRTATADDYEELSTDLTFNRDMSMACADITIINDTLYENDEMFTYNLTTDDSQVVLDPNGGVFVIEDDDTIVIGWEEEVYPVREDEVNAFVCASVLEGELMTPLPAIFVETEDGTAVAKLDYNDTIDDDELIFSADQGRNCIKISILNDLLIEETIENFFVNLIPPIGLERVTIDPNRARIDITDVNEITIGFLETDYIVKEGDGEVKLLVGVIPTSGILGTDIVIRLTTTDNSAKSPDDYMSRDLQLTFNETSSRIDVPVTINDDNLDEVEFERFVSNLQLITVNPRVTVAPSSSNVAIADNDDVVIGFNETTYSILENMTSMVCVSVRTGPNLPVLARTVQITIRSIDGTAMAPIDYNSVDKVLIFDGDTSQKCIPITVNQDDVTDPDEMFNVTLIDEGDPDDVVLDPDVAKVSIINVDIVPPVRVNDTVIGDPLLTVPILVSAEDLESVGVEKLSLCYEVHGASDQIYNLVTDECTSVNAHYHALTSYLNVIDQIGVRATDNGGRCRNIQVDVGGCSASVDGEPITMRYSSERISVRKYNRRVRIMVPNCNDLSVVMWVICETRTLEDPFQEGNSVTGDMLKLVVTRGLNTGHRQSHGIIGQFWNIPVRVAPFTGLDRSGNPVPERYVINITSNGMTSRSYTGWLYDLTWEFEEGPCLYVGNRQAGPIYEVKSPNDAVIQGLYTDYAVPSLFSEDKYIFGQFVENNCGIDTTEISTSSGTIPLIPTDPSGS